MIPLLTAAEGPAPAPGDLAPPSPLVVGGEAADEGDWPAVASLSTDFGLACTGTLVAPDRVLTAGHCGYGLRTARIGSTRADAGGEERGVLDVVVHEDPYTTLDLAVVQLDAPVTTVAPALLAHGCLDPAYADGAEVIIAGYGATDTHALQWPDVLQVAQTTIGDADCSDPDRGCNAAVAPGGELVAGGDGIDSCSGDSGGPLFLAGSGSPAVVVGVTSRFALPADAPCGDGGIYVRGDAAAAWLDELGLPIGRPSCGNHVPALRTEEIFAPRGQLTAAAVAVDDPDPDQGVSVEVLEAPGDVGVVAAGDTLFVRPSPFARPGERRLRVRVRDDGLPPLSSEGEVRLVITATSGPGGCDQAGAAGASGLAVLLSAAARRAPGARRRSG